MICFYLITAGALLPILNNFLPIFEKSYSWWLAPLLYVCFFFGLVLLQIGLVFLAFALGNPNSPSEKSAKFYHFIVKYTLPLIIWLTKVKINLTGMDPDEVPKDRKMLFVCNHQHDFDPAVIYSVFPDNEIGFIGKKDILTKMPFIGKIIRLLNGLFIDRENDREAAKTIIEAIRILKSDKASIGIFPEGYTSKQCELLPFRNGSFKIALKAKVPIVVCVINNTREIPKRMFRFTTKVDFRIVDVIYPEAFEDMNTTELGDMVHQKMETAFNEIRNKKMP